MFIMRMAMPPPPPPADTLQSVELADGVSIHLKVAGPAVRSLAWTIDVCITVVVYLIVFISLGVLGGFSGSGTVVQGFLLLFMFFFNWFYNVFFEMTRHAATPGQRMMGIKVASVSGGPARLPQSMIRNLLRVIDFMPACYLFGLVCSLFNARFQRLGDLVADTVLVYAEPKTANATRTQINAAPQPPAQPLSRDEQAAILQFIERAPQWSDERRIELSDQLSPLTGATGMDGLQRLCAIGLWLRQGGKSGAHSSVS